MKIPGPRFRWFLVAAVAVSLLGASASAALAQQSLSAARQDSAAQSERVHAALAGAAKAGYSDDDMQPVHQWLAQLQRESVPFFPWEQAGYYAGHATQLRALQAEIKRTEAQVDETAKQDLDQQVVAARTGIDNDRTLEVPDQQAAGFAARLDDLGKRQKAAATIGDVRKADTDARALVADMSAAATVQTSEIAAIQQGADSLVQQGLSPAALQAAGNAAVVGGRNDATIAAYEAKPGRFAALNQVMDTYNRMEHYAPRLGSGDLKPLAFATAAVQRYGGQVHQVLMDNLGPKHIVVSFQAQHVWVYHGTKMVMDSAVTTGIRGVTEYGTDFGPMKVLHTDHPWTMHSPFPKGSQYWYPDTVVQWTTFFTNSGESFHDASWESDARLGPGSQYDPSTRSHGCIHLPYSDAQWLYGFADVGTPVDVVPGDGKPLAEQLAEITTDDQGIPLSPA